MQKHVSLKLVKLRGPFASKALGTELLSRLGGPSQFGYSSDFPLYHSTQKGVTRVEGRKDKSTSFCEGFLADRGWNCHCGSNSSTTDEKKQ